MKTFYTNAKIFRNGRFEPGLIAVEGGRIAAAGEPRPGDRVVDLGGRHLVPGLVDVHVHLREPGFPQKETIATGTAAAARGGYTTVCSMPNLNPAPDTPATLGEQLEIIRRDAVVRVKPYGTITMGQRGCGELVDFAALAPQVVGFSDDGRGVQSAELMEEAMRRAAAVGKPIVAHCEVDELLRGGYIHDGVYCREHGHKGICSESEWRQVGRDIALAEKTGCRYHVCHVSTKESVELVRRARAKGLRVSCETAPHYLLLCDEDLQEEGRFKMNPPLRSKADVEALRQGLKDGVMDVISTDHAPHMMSEKDKPMEQAAFGIVGLETSACLTYTELVEKGVLTVMQMAEKMSYNPAKILGLKDRGSVSAGKKADIVVFDPRREYQIDVDTFASKGKNTPFDGWEVKGEVCCTLADGKIVYEK